MCQQPVLLSDASMRRLLSSTVAFVLIAAGGCSNTEPPQRSEAPPDGTPVVLKGLSAYQPERLEDAHPAMAIVWDSAEAPPPLAVTHQQHASFRLVTAPRSKLSRPY